MCETRNASVCVYLPQNSKQRTHLALRISLAAAHCATIGTIENEIAAMKGILGGNYDLCILVGEAIGGVMMN